MPSTDDTILNVIDVAKKSNKSRGIENCGVNVAKARVVESFKSDKKRKAPISNKRPTIKKNKRFAHYKKNGF